MSKISDELREFIDEGDLYPSYIAGLRRIANRIDAEMVELPKGKDGRPIHVGDTVYDESGVACEVVSIGFGRWSGGMAVHAIDGSSEWRNLMPERLTHERPDGLERIADELDEMVDAADSADDSCEKLADLAERIRRLAKEDDK